MNGVFIQRFCRIAHPSGFAHRCLDGLRVKIDIGDGDEQGFEEEPVHGGIFGSESACSMGVLGDAFARMDQEVLQDGASLVLAADRKVAAARSLGSLFALITKHVVFLRLISIRL